MSNSLNIVTICGSLRKDSYNASLARLLPQLEGAAASDEVTPMEEEVTAVEDGVAVG